MESNLEHKNRDDGFEETKEQQKEVPENQNDGFKDSPAIVPKNASDPDNNSVAIPTTQTPNPPDSKGVKEMSLKEKIKSRTIPGGLTITSFILLLVGSQNIWSLVFILVKYFYESLFNTTSISDVLESYWWVSLIFIGFYLILYLMVWKLKKRLKISALSFFVILGIYLTEGVLLIYLSLLLDSLILISAMIQLIFTLYLTGSVAQCLKKNYSGIIGRIVALLSSLISLIFFTTFKILTLPGIAFILITGVVTVYLWKLVYRVETLVKELEGKFNLLTGVYCSLGMFEIKVNWMFGIIIFPYTIYKTTQPDPAEAESITKPLIETKNP